MTREEKLQIQYAAILWYKKTKKKLELVRELLAGEETDEELKEIKELIKGESK